MLFRSLFAYLYCFPVTIRAISGSGDAASFISDKLLNGDTSYYDAIKNNTDTLKAVNSVIGKTAESWSSMTASKTTPSVGSIKIGPLGNPVKITSSDYRYMSVPTGKYRTIAGIKKIPVMKDIRRFTVSYTDLATGEDKTVTYDVKA